MTESEILKDYISLKQICEEYPENFNWWRINYLLRNRKNNGLDKILVKIGIKFYINREDLARWILTI